MADNPVTSAVNGVKNALNPGKALTWIKDKTGQFLSANGWLVIPLFLPVCAYGAAVAAGAQVAAVTPTLAAAGTAATTTTATAATTAATTKLGLLDIGKAWLGALPGQSWADVPVKIKEGAGILAGAFKMAAHGNLGAGVTLGGAAPALAAG